MSPENKNNTLFNKITTSLQKHGYGAPRYVTGHPLSILAGEPFHVQLDFKGPQPHDPKVIEATKKAFQYARLGFQVTDHTGHVSIKHPGTTTPIPDLATLIEDLLGTEVATLHGIAISYKNGTILLQSAAPFIYLTPQQAQEVAEALDKASQAAEDEQDMTPP